MDDFPHNFDIRQRIVRGAQGISNFVKREISLHVGNVEYRGNFLFHVSVARVPGNSNDFQIVCVYAAVASTKHDVPPNGAITAEVDLGEAFTYHHDRQRAGLVLLSDSTALPARNLHGCEEGGPNFQKHG